MIRKWKNIILLDRWPKNGNEVGSTIYFSVRTSVKIGSKADAVAAMRNKIENLAR